MKRLLALLAFLTLGVSAVFAADSAPQLTLRVNDHAPTRKPFALVQGEPVLAEITLEHPDRHAATPLTLDPAAGHWPERVTVDVTDAQGKTVTWPFVLTGKLSPGPLALRPNHRTTLVLRLDASDSRQLAPGDYRLTARLSCADGRGWRGSGLSLYCPVKVVLPLPPGDPAQLGRRQMLRVRDALLRGDLAGGEQEANAMLRAAPQSPEGYAALALVLEAKGEIKRALAALNVAIARIVEREQAVLRVPTPAVASAATPPSSAKSTSKAPAQGPAVKGKAPAKPKPPLVRTPYDDWQHRLEILLPEEPATPPPTVQPAATAPKTGK